MNAICPKWLLADPKARRAAPAAALLCAVLLGAIAPPVAAQSGVISAGDLLYIDVYRRPELSTTAQVDADGNIQMPYVGKVYNLKVEGSDRYLVGKDAIIVSDY